MALKLKKGNLIAGIKRDCPIIKMNKGNTKESEILENDRDCRVINEG